MSPATICAVTSICTDLRRHKLSPLHKLSPWRQFVQFLLAMATICAIPTEHIVSISNCTSNICVFWNEVCCVHCHLFPNCPVMSVCLPLCLLISIVTLPNNMSQKKLIQIWGSLTLSATGDYGLIYWARVAQLLLLFVFPVLSDKHRAVHRGM